MLTYSDIEKALAEEALAAARRRFGVLASTNQTTPERWRAVWSELQASYVDALAAAREVFPAAK